MEFNPHKSFPLNDRSFQSLVKRDISRIAEGLGFSAAEVGKINIITSEMTSNLLKHGAVEGELLVKAIAAGQGLEIICLDKGPGMRDVSRMLEDGVSTVGTSGEGLGAIKRMSDEFDIYSDRGVGTIILSRLYKSRHKPKKAAIKKFDFGVVVVPKTGETDCGDSYGLRLALDKCQILLADGLGHGEYAQVASLKAVAAFLENTHLSPSEIIRNIHSEIKRTRGAVGTVVTIDLAHQTISYCGVGNIAGRIMQGGDASKSIISYNGILGHNIPNTIHDHQLPWAANCLLVLHSDGLKTKWEFPKTKDLNRLDPSILAALLYKTFNRGTDDTMVLVGRTRG